MRFALNFIAYCVGYIVGICLELLGFADVVRVTIESDKDDCFYEIDNEAMREMIARMNEEGPNN